MTIEEGLSRFITVRSGRLSNATTSKETGRVWQEEKLARFVDQA
jgi:hypothetical protein